MPFQQIQNPDYLPTAEGRAWAGSVTLSSGTAQIDYDADLPGMNDPSFANEPYIVAMNKSDDNIFLSSSGTSTATLSDGSGSSSTTVNVLVIEQVS